MKTLLHSAALISTMASGSLAKGEYTDCSAWGELATNVMKLRPEGAT